MPRLAALLLLAGIAVAALPKRRAQRPVTIIADSVVLSEEQVERLALLFCDCPA